MSDLISRQAAMDAIGTLDKFGADERCRIVRWHEGLEPYVHLRDVVTAIANLPSAQQWIPCSERLPEEKDAGILKKLGIEKRSEHVLATIEGNGQRVTGTACTYDGKWDWDMKYAFPDFKVIAWQPIPEPYAER